MRKANEEINHPRCWPDKQTAAVWLKQVSKVITPVIIGHMAQETNMNIRSTTQQVNQAFSYCSVQQFSKCWCRKWTNITDGISNHVSVCSRIHFWLSLGIRPTKSSSPQHHWNVRQASTFTWPKFVYANTCKKPPLEINFIYSGNKEIYCIFKTCCI